MTIGRDSIWDELVADYGVPVVVWPKLTPRQRRRAVKKSRKRQETIIRTVRDTQEEKP